MIQTSLQSRVPMIGSLLATALILVPCQFPATARAQNAPIQLSQARQTAQVIVYGRTTCGLTSQMRRDLEAKGIPYIFKNIDDEPIRREMWGLIRAAEIKYDRSIRLPVLRVKDYILVEASIADVQKTLKR